MQNPAPMESRQMIQLSRITIQLIRFQFQQRLTRLFKRRFQEESAKVSGSSHSSYHREKELDNMRGFDPASEDDMDDNGMQRYFDANDEEAWD